jgi:hypothetical protein
MLSKTSEILALGLDSLGLSRLLSLVFRHKRTSNFSKSMADRCCIPVSDPNSSNALMLAACVDMPV